MGIFLKECWNGGDCHVLLGRVLFDLCWFWCKEAHWRNWSCFCLLCLLSLEGWVVDWGEGSALMAKNREPASAWTRESMQEKRHNTWNSWEEEKETWSLSWWSGFNMRNRKFRRKSEGRERLKSKDQVVRSMQILMNVCVAFLQLTKSCYSLWMHY